MREKSPAVRAGRGHRDELEEARCHPSTSCHTGHAPGPPAQLPLPMEWAVVVPDAWMLQGEPCWSSGMRETQNSCKKQE